MFRHMWVETCYLSKHQNLVVSAVIIYIVVTRSDNRMSALQVVIDSQAKKTPVSTRCIYPQDDPRVFETCCFNKQKTAVLTVIIYTVILPHSRTSTLK